MPKIFFYMKCPIFLGTHLKKTGALLTHPFNEIDVLEQHFSIEASVIIPVWNRILAALHKFSEYLFSHLSHFNSFSP